MTVKALQQQFELIQASKTSSFFTAQQVNRPNNNSNRANTTVALLKRINSRKSCIDCKLQVILHPPHVLWAPHCFLLKKNGSWWVCLALWYPHITACPHNPLSPLIINQSGPLAYAVVYSIHNPWNHQERSSNSNQIEPSIAPHFYSVWWKMYADLIGQVLTVFLVFMQ